MLSIGLRNVSHNLIRRLPFVGSFWFSSSNIREDLLNSQFHAHGLKHFQKSRLMNRNSTTAVFDINKLITELEKQRIKAKELKDQLMIKEDAQLFANGQCSKYLDIYSKLTERMKDVKINEQWGYRVVGWYNLQPFLQILIEDLLDKDKKADQGCLVEAISWMKPHQHHISSEGPVEGLIRHKSKIDQFYNQLVISHSIQALRQIQTIFQMASTSSKSKYFHNYLLNNLDSIIETTSKSQQDIENLLWIFEMYVITLNDDQVIIRKFEDYFLHSKLLERQEVVKTFIRIYNQTGRANAQIYQLYIKPFIRQSPQSVIEVQVLNLEFLIHSEANDQQTLDQTLKNIAKIARTQPISDAHRLHVHYLLHYLKIKNIRFNFPFQLIREFSEVCRTFEEDGTFAKTIAVQLDQKSRREGIQYYNSSCMLKKRIVDSGKKEKQGEPIPKVKGVKKYKQVKFCCLNLDFCVYDDNKRQGTVLQKNYHRFSHSSRLVRIEEVKAEVLRHYGLEINYLETQNQLNRRR